MASQPPAAATAVLPEELVEEILLRSPPDDPASLVRAALVCKPWRRLLSGRGFLRRYGALHRTAPMLGFVVSAYEQGDEPAFVARFVPTSSFRAPRADRRGLRALDARHGRVLLRSLPLRSAPSDNVFSVWDPVTDEQLELPNLPLDRDLRGWSFNAAVLCAAAGGGCDHLDCRGGPFLVVFVALGDTEAFACVYSSEDGAWSELTYAQHISEIDSLATVPGALVENALYFMLHWSVLKYDLITREVTVIHQPATIFPRHIVRTVEGGGLGIIGVKDSVLYQWSREAGPDEHDGWSRTLLPSDPFRNQVCVVGFADGTSIIFVVTIDGLFSIDLKSSQVRKIELGVGTSFFNVFPYMTFYTPAIEVASGQGP